MAFLSRNDIEALAGKILSNYKNLHRFDDFPADWVDPYILAHDLLGLTIDYYHLSDDGSILGLTSQSVVGVEVMDDDGQQLIYCLDGRTILIETALREDESQRGRHNFTVMHETAQGGLSQYPPLQYYLQAETQRRRCQSGTGRQRTCPSVDGHSAVRTHFG